MPLELEAAQALVAHVALHGLQRVESLVVDQGDVTDVDLLLQVLHEAGHVDAVVEVGHVEAVCSRHVRQVLVQPRTAVRREEVAALVEGCGGVHLKLHVLVGRHLRGGHKACRLRLSVFRVRLRLGDSAILARLLARAALLLQCRRTLTLARRALLEGLA